MTDIVEDQGAGAAPSEDDEWNAAHENQYGPQTDDKGGDDDDKSNAGGDKSAAGAGDDGDKGAAAKGDEDDAGDKGAAKTGEDDDDDAEDAKNQKAQFDPTIAVARRTARQLAEERSVFIKDAREKLYPDLKTELTDSEGKPIRNTADLMRLENPATGKAFTEEEAAGFLLKAQSHVAKQNEEADARAEQVADVLMTVNDESQEVKAKWGGLLAELEKSKPGFADALLARYKQQLEVDATGIITGYKMSPMEFYDTVLDGYDMARKALQSGDEKVAEVSQEQKKTQVKLDKARRKQDRSDITSGSNTDVRDEDDKEWDAAHQNQFGPNYNSKKK